MHPNQLFIEKSEKILRTRPKGCCYLLYLDITDFQYINSVMVLKPEIVCLRQ